MGSFRREPKFIQVGSEQDLERVRGELFQRSLQSSLDGHFDLGEHGELTGFRINGPGRRDTIGTVLRDGEGRVFGLNMDRVKAERLRQEPEYGQAIVIDMSRTRMARSRAGRMLYGDGRYLLTMGAIETVLWMNLFSFMGLNIAGGDPLLAVFDGAAGAWMLKNGTSHLRRFRELRRK